MIQLSALIGHVALDASTATSMGTISGVGLVADRIVSVEIGGECVDAASVHGFGGDVVTYDPIAGAHGGPQPPAIDPRGSRVLDLHGDLLGTISDLTITDAGVVSAILLRDGHTLAGDRLQVIGSYAAIVSCGT